ncbi:unnamed protein product [Phaedon cochleariae]|uniref:R3H domain-containing protein n=1 Tax=Phaedon cochleariae TaxID=80249 RepID=A0A9P0DQQ0_PHACE|nr:unnamed protein product [Phaedon cochleariae]
MTGTVCRHSVTESFNSGNSVVCFILSTVSSPKVPTPPKAKDLLTAQGASSPLYIIMTVIKEKQGYNYPKPNSAAASDTESLNLGSVPASDTESINNDEPHRVHRLPLFRLPLHGSQVEELINIKKNSGRKKLRRYQNRCVLPTFEEDEEEKYVLMESYKGPFTRLLEDKVAMECWNNFIEKSEEEQSQIMRQISENYCNDQINNSPSDDFDSPGKISSRIRRTFKIRKNLQFEVIDECETDLIQFFETRPEDTYVKFPPTSFDRLLIHAIAQYHKLKSISVLYGDDARRSVEVYNVRQNWICANCRLADFIKKLRT